MITKQKGTYDIYGQKARNWNYINQVISSFAEIYNYDYIRTPIFEASELFHRGVGETSDIVTKETYDFQDRGERNITLRPEGTAGVVRSYIENKLYGSPCMPQKLYYNGTMYRYERPQSGRNREFTQFGMEVLGSNDPLIDAEIISLPIKIFETLGLKNLKVNINSLGDLESRKRYEEALISYLKPHISSLCDDCQNRFLKNPLRILDCKKDADSEILKNAPKMTDYLNDESKKRFDQVLNYLDCLDINYVINPNIVRGLDYYDHTVFEITADIKELGSGNVLAAGGRYNHLVENLDGPETPAMGFACGIDRLLFALETLEIPLADEKQLDAYVMYVNDEEKEYGIYLTQELRLNGFKTEIENCSRSLKNQFKQADRYNAKYLIILNSEDLKNSLIQVKDNITKEITKVKEVDIIDHLDLHI